MKRLSLALLVAALATTAAPAAPASAQEPIDCWVLNTAGQIVFGEDIATCIDPPGGGLDDIWARDAAGDPIVKETVAIVRCIANSAITGQPCR